MKYILTLLLAALMLAVAPSAQAAGTAEFCYREPGRNIGTLPNLGTVLNDFGSCEITISEIGDQDGDLTPDEVIYFEDKQALGNSGGQQRCTTFNTTVTSALVGDGCFPAMRLIKVQCDDDSGNKGPAAFMTYTVGAAPIIPVVFAPNLLTEAQVLLGSAPEQAHYRESSTKVPNFRGLNATDPLTQCSVSAIDNTTTPGTEIVVETLAVAAGSVSGGNLKTANFTASLASVSLFRFQCETTGGVKQSWVELTGAEGVNTPQSPREFEIYDD